MLIFRFKYFVYYQNFQLYTSGFRAIDFCVCALGVSKSVTFWLFLFTILKK